MSKNSKKETIKVKFDTSSANIDCFIGKKSRQKMSELDYDKKHKKARKKSKVLKDKNQEFQANDFLGNIISNVLNEDFSNPKQIQDLIENMKFSSSGEMDEKGQGGKNKKIEENESLQAEIFSIIALKNRPDSNYRSIIKSCQQELMKEDILDSKWIECEQKVEDTTTHQSNSSTPSLTPRRVEDEKREQFEMFSPITEQVYQNYNNYPFYNAPSLYYNSQIPLRKKKTCDENADNRINLEKIEYDGRTTIMIRHIPNKYTEEMLLQEINKNHRIKFNFLYLPIDYNNTCNVGYAFVNFIHTKFISDFYHEFHGKKWNKFNSQKICELAYARIQGTTSLMDHYQNSHSALLREKKIKASELDEYARQDINKMINGQKEAEDI